MRLRPDFAYQTSMLEPRLTRGEARSYTIPTDLPEADGTITWNSTTIVTVTLQAADQTGIGFTYTHRAAADLIREHFLPAILGRSAFNIPAAWGEMTRAARNLGRPGLGLMAISAVDFALWDLKAKLLGVPLHRLLGMARKDAPIYGSGGFTTYSISQLSEQLADWTSKGISRVKMKIGSEPAKDVERVRAARAAIGPRAALFVDANGAYDRKQAMGFAERFADQGVSWFEEPVSSDDLEGLRLLRDRAPAGMQIAAGEYGFDGGYFRRMLEAGAVDTLQADATRCGGITGFLEALALAKAWNVPVSTHCAPSMHVALGCHSRQIVHLEYFHDHARVERVLFDGVVNSVSGRLRPDDSALGFGLTMKARDAEAFAA